MLLTVDILALPLVVNTSFEMEFCFLGEGSRSNLDTLVVDEKALLYRASESLPIDGILPCVGFVTDDNLVTRTRALDV